MRVGNFSVLIPEGRERDSGHVGLEHGEQYTLRLMNHTYQQCDAEVQIDGKPIGTFRLGSFGSARLERSPDDNGKFTFYKSGSDDAQKAGESEIMSFDKGLVVVRFTPEKVKAVKSSGIYGASAGVMRSASSEWSSRPLGLCSTSHEKTSGGITGLSGHSDQKFTTVGAIDLDESEAVTISLRLVTWTSGPRPLKASRQANQIPEPV